MACMRILFVIIVCSYFFATYSSDRYFCTSKYCWFSHADNPKIVVKLETDISWYTDLKLWVKKINFTEKSDKNATVKSSCVPILNIVSIPIQEWKKEINKKEVEFFISGYKTAPFSYAEIKKTPDVNAYVMKKNYNAHKEQALNFIIKKTASLITKTDENARAVAQLLKNYLHLINATPIPCWHSDCTGLIVPLRSVLAITTITSIAEAQKR